MAFPSDDPGPDFAVDGSGKKHGGEALLRLLVEAAPNAMVMVDAAGRIQLVNAQTERVFGYKREELLGQSVDMLVPRRFAAQHPGLRDSFFADPRSRPMGAGRDLHGLRKDGTEFPVEIGLNPIKTDEGVMVLSAIVDISERKRNEERLRQVVEAAPNAMVMIDEAGRIEMVNAQAEKLFGYERDEMLGQSVEMLVPSRFAANHPVLRTSFFADPRSRPMGAGRDLYGLRKDGTEVPVEIGLNPIETDDGVKVLSAIVDISERKQRESRIEAALHEKDVLLGEIHHRVKNNLQIVDSLLELQAGRVADPAVLSILSDSQNRIRAMSMIHQTLYQSHDFANIDFGGFLNKLLPALIASYDTESAKISLEIEATEVSMPMGAAIPCGLLVNELITNSVKHAFPGRAEGRIRVVLKSGAAPRQVTLAIEDDGIGLPENLDISKAETLGLLLVDQLADQLQADLTINRVDPTRFYLTFFMDG